MPVITLAEAKQQLNRDPGDTSVDDELQTYCDATGEAVEYYIGPVDDRAVTELHDGGGFLVALNTCPVVALTAVTTLDGTTAHTVDELDVDHTYGLVRPINGRPLQRGKLRFTFTAGRGGEIPASGGLAARIILQHMWRTQHSSDARRPGLPGMDDEVTMVPGLGYAVPNRAIEMLAPLNLGPGIA